MARYGCTITVNSGQIPSAQSNFAWLATEVNFPAAAIDGGASSVLNGGGNLRCYTDSTKATQIPIEVVTFVTGASPSVIVWGLSPSLNVASTVYIEADDTATTQPPAASAYGSESVWAGYEMVTHDGVTDSAGNYTVIRAGAVGLSTGVFGNASGASTDAYAFVATNKSRNQARSIKAWTNLTAGKGAVAGLYSTTSSADWTSLQQRDSDSGGAITANSVNAWLRTLSTGTFSFNASQGGVTWAGWQKVGANFSSSERSAYIGAADRSSNTVSVSATGSYDRFSMGLTLDSTPGDAVSGSWCEVWWKESTVSLDEQEAEYNNQNSPVSFWSTSDWEDQDGGGVSGDVNLDIEAVEFTGTGVATLPSPQGDVSFDLIAVEFNASGSATFPQPSGSVSFNVSQIEFGGTGSATQPNPSGNASFNIELVEFSGVGGASVPFPAGNVSFDVAPVEFNASGGATFPKPSGDINFNIETVEFSGFGNATQPDPVGDISLDIAPIEFSATGSVSGIALPYGEIIRPRTESNVIMLNTPPNLIKLY